MVTFQAALSLEGRSMTWLEILIWGDWGGGELKEFKDRKPQSVYKSRDLLPRRLMSSLRWGGVLIDLV